MSFSVTIVCKKVNNINMVVLYWVLRDLCTTNPHPMSMISGAKIEKNPIYAYASEFSVKSMPKHILVHKMSWWWFFFRDTLQVGTAYSESIYILTCKCPTRYILLQLWTTGVTCPLSINSRCFTGSSHMHTDVVAISCLPMTATLSRTGVHCMLP